ncbi:hypothetical protein OS493_003280 [Desmophyllum pertusum]|uniref:UPAR/Ly6 domain-containing protein n=1 Tax=Desmophyllum pertusum TaxID=174260 RepID=A0A9W9YH78_9CNID|nr:hypothetical protein OS493_003280 [Desmophyllum pertusum]
MFASMRWNCVQCVSFVMVLAINAPCFSEGLRCYACHSNNSWKECEGSLRLFDCPDEVDEVCVKEYMVEHDNNNEKGIKETFSKSCGQAVLCTNKNCKKVGKTCEPHCCHTDLCNTATMTTASHTVFVIYLLLWIFVVMYIL